MSVTQPVTQPAQTVTAHVAQLGLVPNLYPLLQAILQATGLQWVFDSVTDLENIIKSSDPLNQAALDKLLGDIKTGINQVGPLVQGGGFQKVLEEIDKYANLLVQLNDGVTVTVTSIIVHGPGNEDFEYVATLQRKQAPAPVPTPEPAHS